MGKTHMKPTRTGQDEREFREQTLVGGLEAARDHATIDHDEPLAIVVSDFDSDDPYNSTGRFSCARLARR